MVDYKELLEHSLAVETEDSDNGDISRLQYLADHIFDFTTYDSGMSEVFASKAVEVCAAITDGKTFNYIKDAENYKWYLLMCNMPFFASRLNWGTSIRGAWWDPPTDNYVELQSCGLWDGHKQLTKPIRFKLNEWESFMRAVVAFAADTTKEAT